MIRRGDGVLVHQGIPPCFGLSRPWNQAVCYGCDCFSTSAHTRAAQAMASFQSLLHLYHFRTCIPTKVPPPTRTLSHEDKTLLSLPHQFTMLPSPGLLASAGTKTFALVLPVFLNENIASALRLSFLKILSSVSFDIEFLRRARRATLEQ